VEKNKSDYSKVLPDYDEEDDNNKVLLLNKQGKNQKHRKMVCFHGMVQVHEQVVQLPLSHDEKSQIWYTKQDIQNMKKHHQRYVKYLRSINPKILEALLKNEAKHDGKFWKKDDDILCHYADEPIICRRGLEKFIGTRHHCHQSLLPSPLLLLSYTNHHNPNNINREIGTVKKWYVMFYPNRNVWYHPPAAAATTTTNTNKG
jgi:hypothetical protein